MTVASMIPSAVTPAEVEVLQKLASHRTVLEVGSLFGASTIAMAKVAEHVVSVDPHHGYPKDNPRPTLTTFLYNLERAGVRDKVTVIAEPHDKAFRWLSREFDLVFIDCTAEEELTFDIMREASKLMRHYGTMCVHDIDHPQWPGAREAVDRFARTYEVVDRLAIIKGTWGWYA